MDTNNLFNKLQIEIKTNCKKKQDTINISFNTKIFKQDIDFTKLIVSLLAEFKEKKFILHFE